MCGLLLKEEKLNSNWKEAVQLSSESVDFFRAGPYFASVQFLQNLHLTNSHIFIYIETKCLDTLGILELKSFTVKVLRQLLVL